MKRSDFNKNRTGELVAVKSVDGSKCAFVPGPFPPSSQWEERLWPLLLEARMALAGLNGVGKHLPNANLLLKPLQNREAQRSSKLEGTITSPQQQGLFEIDPRYPASDDDPINSLREIYNYATALNVWQNPATSKELTRGLIGDLHKTLMEGVRGAEQRPGQFRDTVSQVGRPARFVPPPPEYLEDLMANLEQYMQARETDIDPLVDAFRVHYQIEAIHPFRDGNGRVGRLLLSILIMEWCQLSEQWMYMSAFFETNKDEYTRRMYRVSSRGEWGDWMEFCLRGTIEQARDAERRCERLLALNQKYTNKVKEIGGSVRLSSIVNDLFVQPFTSIPALSRSLRVTYNTAKSDAAKLSSAGILAEVQGGASRTLFSPEIFEITYEE